jgi:hypothetical protein
MIGGVTAGVGMGQPASTILTAVEVIDLSSPSGGYAKIATSHAGGAGNANLPANACVVCNYFIQRRYRGGKPRSYWPMGLTTDLVNPQTFSAASVTNFTSHITATLAPFNSTAYVGGALSGIVSVSYYSGAKWAENPITGAWKRYPTLRATPVVDSIGSFAVDPLVGSQRRRIRGRT